MGLEVGQEVHKACLNWACASAMSAICMVSRCIMRNHEINMSIHVIHVSTKVVRTCQASAASCRARRAGRANIKSLLESSSQIVASAACAGQDAWEAQEDYMDYGLIWFDMVWYCYMVNMVIYGYIWLYMVCHGLTWFDMVWHYVETCWRKGLRWLEWP
jgi:hypothetical protein